MLLNDKIIQNLKDAGCEKSTIDAFMTSTGDKARLQLLERHRKQLLDNVHKYQKRIDCLDFLIYQMEKNN